MVPCPACGEENPEGFQFCGFCAASRAKFADQGSTIMLGLTDGHASAEVELLAGNPAAAAEFAERGCRVLEQTGDKAWLSTALGYLAQAQYQLNKLDEADASAARAAELGASDDAITQMLWRQVKAKVLARHDEPDKAERLAGEAIVIGTDTDMPSSLGDAHLDLAEVLTLAGRTDEASEQLREALALYECKGNLVMAARARELITDLS